MFCPYLVGTAMRHSSKTQSTLWEVISDKELIDSDWDDIDTTSLQCESNLDDWIIVSETNDHENLLNHIKDIIFEICNIGVNWQFQIFLKE